MSMKDFCMQFGVESGAEERLATNSYGHARLFSLITIQELKDMKFLVKLPPCGMPFTSGQRQPDTPHFIVSR